MTTKNNKQQAGPIAQQLAKIQSNEQQVITPQLNGQQPPIKKSRWGLSDKTFWDWFQLLIIPIILALVSFSFGYWQYRISDANSQRQHETDLQIAADQQRETTLQTYLDDMTTLLLDKKLGSQVVTDEAASAEATVVARAKTLTALRRLDPLRKGLLIQFLYEAQLITGQFPIISLRDADLSGINLGSNTSLNSPTNSVYGPGPVGESNHCHLEHINFDSADLKDAYLKNAGLSNAFLQGAYLGGADLSGADLSEADLSRANLNRALVTDDQLAQAKSLKGAIMPDGSKHP